MSDHPLVSYRARSMRAWLDGVAVAAFDWPSGRALVAGPPAPAGLPDMGGRRVPSEVRDFYSIAASACAFGFTIVAAEQLPAVNVEHDHQLSRYPLSHGGDLPWGPPPVGDALVVATSPGNVCVAEAAGRPSGVTILDVGGDQGYRWMAPSLGRLLQTWTKVAEAGVIEVRHDPGGNPHLAVARNHSDVAKARDVCHRMSCSLAAVGLYADEAEAWR